MCLEILSSSGSEGSLEKPYFRPWPGRWLRGGEMEWWGGRGSGVGVRHAGTRLELRDLFPGAKVQEGSSWRQKI